MKWTVETLLKRASQILKERGIKTPRLDAELLLTHSLGLKNRVNLYSEFKKPLTEEEVERYRQLIIRRAKGEPVAYITKEKEFFGFTFKVEKGVLIPRPETELLVEIAYEYLKNKTGKTVVDVGTGSGCIILSLCKLLGEKHKYYGTDVSSLAIKVAEKNKNLLNCKNVTFLKTNLLKGIEEPIDVIISNPPYIPINDKDLEENVKKFEPAIALFGGKDGLEVIKALVSEASRKLKSGGFIALEIGKGQAPKVKELLEKSGFTKIKLFKDLNKIERVITGEKSWKSS